MQYKFFSVPAHGGIGFEQDLNLFLRSHRILAVRREFVLDGSQSFWACCVEYLDSAGSGFSEQGFPASRKKMDYRELLSEEQFMRFRVLREARKELSKTEAVPAYAIFLDEQLAELSKIEGDLSLSKLKSLKGFGDGKCERWGDAFLKTLKSLQNHETGGESLSADSES